MVLSEEGRASYRYGVWSRQCIASNSTWRFMPKLITKEGAARPEAWLTICDQREDDLSAADRSSECELTRPFLASTSNRIFGTHSRQTKDCRFDPLTIINRRGYYSSCSQQQEALQCVTIAYS